MAFSSPSFTHPRMGVEDPSICVESTLAASNFTRPTHRHGSPRMKAHSSHVPESRLAKPKRDQEFSKPKSATHRRRSPHICVGSQKLMLEELN
ncbi:hypothetical protein PIB30_103428, partial [Stylosanthes scabra]|nr:hypothetical protein [Stylosanthes scabra]